MVPAGTPNLHRNVYPSIQKIRYDTNTHEYTVHQKHKQQAGKHSTAPDTTRNIEDLPSGVTSLAGATPRQKFKITLRGRPCDVTYAKKKTYKRAATADHADVELVYVG